ncbi:MAG: hypothetical protein EU549_03670 [Promethearchaeota archaeon]|nr:MAG: hypothetical protein EU549_03670 [Candidatus Lokiarchaeota archaeon]
MIFIYPSISFPVSVILSLILARKVYSYPIIKYKIQKSSFLQYLDLVYQDFLIILKSNGTVFDFIKYISESNYPVIAKKFKEMIKNLNYGSDPERLLLNFINFTGIRTFKEKMLFILSSNLKKGLILNDKPEFSLELTTSYQKYTKQLNTRITIITTINIFLPLLSIILFSIYFAVNPFSYLILIPFHFLILYILKKSLLKKEFLLLGALKNNENEFNSLLIFLMLFSNYLKMNNSPEIALIKSIKLINSNSNLSSYQFRLPNELIEYHLEDFWMKLIHNFKHYQSKILLKLILRMLNKNSQETGLRIENILDNIKSNRKIISERKIIIKSLQFKSLLLLFILSCLIGLFSTIIPIIGNFFQLIFIYPSNFSMQNEYSLISYLPLLLTYSSIIISTTIIILNIVRIKKIYHFSIVFFIIYISIFYGSYILVNSYSIF